MSFCEKIANLCKRQVLKECEEIVEEAVEVVKHGGGLQELEGKIEQKIKRDASKCCETVCSPEKFIKELEELDEVKKSK